MEPIKSREQQKQEIEQRALATALSGALDTSKIDNEALREAGGAYIAALVKAVGSSNEADLLIELLRDKGYPVEIVGYEKPKPLDLSAFAEQALFEHNRNDAAQFKPSDEDPDELDEDDEDDESAQDEVGKRRRRGTVLNLIMATLNESGAPLTTSTIINRVIKRLGENVPTSTITNNLTRLVRANKLIRKATADNSTSTYALPEWNDEVSEAELNHEDKVAVSGTSNFDLVSNVEDEDVHATNEATDILIPPWIYSTDQK